MLKIGPAVYDESLPFLSSVLPIGYVCYFCLLVLGKLSIHLYKL